MSELIPKHGGYRKLKSFQVVRASLEELKLDYEDFLRQQDLPMLEPDHPVLMRFKRQKPQTIKDYEKLCPEVNRRSLQRDLKNMIEKGLLESHGETNKLIYVLKE